MNHILKTKNIISKRLVLNAFFVTVTPGMVKKLRELTNAPMMKCKMALSDPDVNGDYQKAVHWLRKNGIRAAEKTASRTANEGVVAMKNDKKYGLLVGV